MLWIGHITCLNEGTVHLKLRDNFKHFITSDEMLDLNFGDGDGPNLCRVKKVDVSSTFSENIFRSGLTLVSYNDIITIKIYKKNC